MNEVEFRALCKKKNDEYFESLCLKMGYNPLKEHYPSEYKNDDSGRSPFKVLSLEELDFLTQYMQFHRNEMYMVLD